ncbi:response regulator transcription factor [Tepidibacter hydrothermalis]|uniref:Helix-turn-helix transcriptional regulator n=1 Tax=Tepidibacter hydrothermalis TaxID=3036126 RepID=A0ABY8E7L5_9FIRM|nr:response regulator transcription factor [Tepidibacter hydrothermalis]WFD08883.1 helix-turn-helix transcriptional regulator [Tepidibacter hydrothermalis]
MKREQENLQHIYRLIGKVDLNNLKIIDAFVNSKIGMFMPISGSFKHAVESIHTHPSYMFVLTFNDQVSFKIDDKEIVTQPGRLIAISPFIVHQEIYLDHSPRYIAIFIDKEFFDSQLKEYNLEEIKTFKGDFIQIPQGFQSLIKEFMIEADNRLQGWEQVMSSLNVRIIHSIIRSLIGLKHNVGQITSRLDINRTVEYMYDHMGQKLTIEDISSFANMSSSHFTRVFKKEMGQTVIDYLTDIRLEKVKHLLMLGEKSITEIGFECGFSSTSYLSTVFQKRFGQSPSEYRRSFMYYDKINENIK